MQRRCAAELDYNAHAILPERRPQKSPGCVCSDQDSIIKLRLLYSYCFDAPGIQFYRVRADHLTKGKPIPTQFQGESPDPVLVMGMHNSGSTALSKCLHQCGLFMVNNATQCESHFFSNYVNDQLLMGGGSEWAKLPIMTVEEVMSYRDTVGQFMLDQWRIDLMQWGYDGVSPWGIKDARTCVLLPLYLDVFPNSKILFIRRDPDDIAASLAHREKPGVGVMNDPAHWKALTLEHFKRVEEFGHAHHSFHEVSYEELCQKPVEVARQVHKFLNLPLTPEHEAVYQQTMRRDRLGTKAWSAFKWRVMAIRKGFQVMWE